MTCELESGRPWWIRGRVNSLWAKIYTDKTKTVLLPLAGKTLAATVFRAVGDDTRYGTILNPDVDLELSEVTFEIPGAITADVEWKTITVIIEDVADSQNVKPLSGLIEIDLVRIPPPELPSP